MKLKMYGENQLECDFVVVYVAVTCSKTTIP